MTAFIDLLPEVLPDVPGCSDPLAEQAVRNACIRMCEASDIIKLTSDPFDLAADEPRYMIQGVPDGYAYNQVLWATIDGAQIGEKSQDFLDLVWRDINRRHTMFSLYHSTGYDNAADGWRAVKQQRPEFFFIERENNQDLIRLVGIPSTTMIDALQYRLSLKPKRTASGVFDWVAEDHYLLIAKGAISELLMKSKKPWTDTARGKMLEGEFLGECTELKALSLRDFNRDDHANLRTRAYS